MLTKILLLQFFVGESNMKLRSDFVLLRCLSA